LTAHRSAAIAARRPLPVGRYRRRDRQRIGDRQRHRQPFRNEWVQKYVVKDDLSTRMAEYNVQVEPRA
jgi:hypothetical protein